MDRESAEPDILWWQKLKNLRVYSGTGRVCPYGGGRHEKKEDEKANWKIEKIERRDKRREQGRAETLEELIAIGRSRGYKNPVFWARMVYNSRAKKMTPEVTFEKSGSKLFLSENGISR